ncbi:hypothetical protein [Aureispira sp. CCB-E]|uniref:hypothetical protein n=1 Tax=Aureispira sp. CCB-E TaxID=3051121 RepID=UPI0028692F08|nr:hypothetical protein [Aureispira sp. CCB-E]WMX16424.1 hypothetical protein QP953_08595 [Aureispira sp. CCB-E]
MQYILLLICFIISPSLIFGQNSDTEKRMQELGFVKVDLDELAKQQTADKKACSSCPMKQVNTTTSSPKINHAHEIDKLKNQLPHLEQAIKDAKASTNVDPSMLQKYQTALKNTKDRIQILEKELAQLKSSYR